MKVYTVMLKGRSTRTAVEERAAGTIRVEAWDRGQARTVVEQRTRTGYVINGVKCDEVEIVRVR
jgi:hypothetical protein